MSIYIHQPKSLMWIIAPISGERTEHLNSTVSPRGLVRVCCDEWRWAHCELISLNCVAHSFNPCHSQSKHLSALISSLCPLPPPPAVLPPHPATSCKAFRLPAVDTNPNLWPINAQPYWIQDHNMVLSRRLMTRSSAINSDLRCHQSLYQASTKGGTDSVL